MGRKSKLTESQWADIEKRLLEGEASRALAKEFGVSEGLIRKRKGTRVKQIKAVGNQIVTAELAYRALDSGTREGTQRYAAKLLAISDDMLDGAAHAASTFRQLSAIASTEMQKVDVVDPHLSLDTLKNVSALTSMANEAAKTPINLIAANKEAVRDMAQVDNPAAKTITWDEFYGKPPKSKQRGSGVVLENTGTQ